jgi:hypothetical protein
MEIIACRRSGNLFYRSSIFKYVASFDATPVSKRFPNESPALFPEIKESQRSFPWIA